MRVTTLFRCRPTRAANADGVGARACGCQIEFRNAGKARQDIISEISEETRIDRPCQSGVPADEHQRPGIRTAR